MIKSDLKAARAVQRFEGRRAWLLKGGLSFEATPHNLRALADVYGEVEVRDSRETGQPLVAEPAPRAIEYQSATSPYLHQDRALAALLAKPHAHLLSMEQGTGKTKVAIDFAGTLYGKGEIDAVLVIAPKGVHRQWAEVQIPLHLGTVIPRQIAIYERGKKFSVEWQPTKLHWLCVNIDAVRTDKGRAICDAFLDFHSGRALVIVDESHLIKTYSTGRTQACCELGQKATNRLAMTGTPIAKDLRDEWSQFMFLDPNIIGIKYETTFIREFCITDNDGRVIDHKDLDRFKALVDPYSFRVLKSEELDLPEKVYNRWTFDLSPEQRRHYDELKHQFFTWLDSGDRVTVEHALSHMLRLQQVTCGYLPAEDGSLVRLPNARIEALKELIDTLDGKVIVWARFQEDLDQIKELLGDEAVEYHGRTPEAIREEGKRLFCDPKSDIRYFISNPATGGTGVDGLQNACHNAVYYSNSFNAVHRWQSEDRIHRIGTSLPPCYTDLVGKRTIDIKILANLREKKNLSDLALGDIAGMLRDD